MPLTNTHSGLWECRSQQLTHYCCVQAQTHSCWSSVGSNFQSEQEVGLQTSTSPSQQVFPGVCDPAQESCPVAQGSTVHTSEKERDLGIGRSYWVYTQGIILETRLWCWFLFLHQSLVFFFGRDSANWRYQGGAEEVYSNRSNKQGKAETKHWDIGWRAKPQILPRP